MYRITLTVDKEEIAIPVLPEQLEIKSAGKNEKAEVLQLGEITIVRKKGLREISWSSFFSTTFTQSALSVIPIIGAYIKTTSASDAIEIIRTIQKWRDEKKVAQLSTVGFKLDTPAKVAIQDFRYSEKFGELGDIYYTITLREWVEYAPKKLNVEGTIENPEAVIAEDERPGVPEDLPQVSGEGENRTYKVQADDNLWTVAQKVYGDSSKWLDIYNKSKVIIDGGNAERRAFVYEIIAGQVLDLP